VWEEEDKQALKRRKKCLYHHRLKTHRKTTRARLQLTREHPLKKKKDKK
jgi:hypothetical protein